MYFKFCVAAFISLYLSAATGSFIEDTEEDMFYSGFKTGLIEAGDSEFHADCTVIVLRAIGATKDVPEILFDPDTNLDKFTEKARSAHVVCSPPGLIIAVLLFGCAFLVCCCCFVQCCIRCTKKSVII